jgi:hypothetical protein
MDVNFQVSQKGKRNCVEHEQCLLLLLFSTDSVELWSDILRCNFAKNKVDILLSIQVCYVLPRAFKENTKFKIISIFKSEIA